MAEPIRLRAQLEGSEVVVRAFITHPMESGQRKGPDGQRVPKWHIQTVLVQVNGQDALRAQWGPGVSKNPLLQCRLRGVAVGDRVSVTWSDSRGDSRTDTTVVS